MLFFMAQYSGIEKLLAILLICAEVFVLLHGLGYALNILRSLQLRKDGSVSERALVHEPSVAILVAARHEPREVLENTFITLNNLNYKNKTVYFLDDSSDDKYKKEAEEISREYKLVLVRRISRHGAKAGIINDCLRDLNQQYVAVFDADQNPLPDFLKVIIPILENNERIAFVQTPQFYTNLKNRIARAAAFQQAVFYEYICEGKNSGGSMFCCGTNVVFRTKALKEVGGLDESTVTEDFATSVKLHVAGWKSLYYNHVYAFGMGPENLEGYFKQQFRWATGTISVFKNLFLRFFTRPFSLEFGQWWEYMLSSSYYMVGIAFFVMISCPIIYLFFRVPSFFMKPEVYLFAFLPYIILSTQVLYFALKGRKYKAKDLFQGQLLSVCTMSVYMRAALSAFLGIKTTFGITAKKKTRAVAYIRLWPQLSLLLLDFIAIVWGINRYIYEREPAILINSFWVIYHFLVLSSIFYFNAGQE